MYTATTFRYAYDKGNDTVLLHNKQHTHWRYNREWPTAFTCAVTSLRYYADAGPCYTCDELSNVLISAEGIAKLREQGFPFLK